MLILKHSLKHSLKLSSSKSFCPCEPFAAPEASFSRAFFFQGGEESEAVPVASIHSFQLHTPSSQSHIFTSVTHLHVSHTLSCYSHTSMLVTHLHVSHTPPCQLHTSMLVTHLNVSHTPPCQSQTYLLVTHLHLGHTPQFQSHLSNQSLALGRWAQSAQKCQFLKLRFSFKSKYNPFIDFLNKIIQFRKSLCPKGFPPQKPYHSTFSVCDF